MIVVADTMKVVALLKGLTARIGKEGDAHGWNPFPWVQEIGASNLEQVGMLLGVAQFAANPDLSDNDYRYAANDFVQNEPLMRLLGLYEAPAEIVLPPSLQLKNPLGALFAPGKRYAAAGDTRQVGEKVTDEAGMVWVKVGKPSPFGMSVWYEWQA